MIQLISFYSGLAQRIVESKLFKFLAKNTLISTLTLVGLVVFWSFPSYDIPILTNEMEDGWADIIVQIDNPFNNHNHLFQPDSHAEKLAFRFVPPVILNLLGIKSLIPILIFQFFSLIIFYYLLVVTFNKIFKEKTKALLYSIPICFVISGHVYASDYRGIFDTVALDFMLMALLARNKIYVIVPLLLAYFTDERAIIASSALFLITLIDNNGYQDFKSILKNIFFPSTIYLVISWILYIIIRLTLGEIYGLEARTGGIKLFFYHNTFYTFYIGLEGFILPLALVILFLLKKRFYTFTTLLIAVYLVVFIVAQSVIDINRSMSYIILFIILVLIIFDKIYSDKKAYGIILIVININILYDDFYPFLLQLYRMKFITNTI